MERRALPCRLPATSGRLVDYRRQWEGPADVRASMLSADGSPIATGFIIGSDVVGSDSVTAGLGNDFSVLYEGLPKSAATVTLRTVSPK